MSIKCEFCDSTVSSKYVLKNHLLTNKSCLNIRNIEPSKKFICKGCEYMATDQQKFSLHCESCKSYQILLIKNEHQIEIKEKELTILNLKNQLDEHKNYYIEYIKLKVEHEKLTEQYDELKIQYEKTIAKLEMKINQFDSFIQGIVTERFNSFNNEAVIEIDNDIGENKEENEEEYKLQPLDLGDNLYIENREDGYINVTNLCKAGNKKFSHWNLLDNTKAFLKELSRSAGIPADLLIQSLTGGKNEDRKTWVHPYVAINIAQWISPQFDVKVSSWIYEVMLTGKIDISKTKSFQQLRLENKEHKLRIQYLTKKYVKLQPRVQYNEKNVIYILTTPSHKKEGKYILGKAANLTNRLSTYNKTDEHEVVYYQECSDEDTMAMVEQVVFQRLKDYREQANRERFILPENKTIELFIDVIKKSIEFLK